MELLESAANPPCGFKAPSAALSAALGLVWTARFCVDLQSFQRRKWMILRIGRHDRQLENRVRPARVGIDPQEQRIGREAAKIDDAVDDRLRRVGNLGADFERLIDQISELGNLLWRCKDQIDRLVDLVLDRVEGNDAGLPDPRPNKAADGTPAAASGVLTYRGRPR